MSIAEEPKIKIYVYMRVEEENGSVKVHKEESGWIPERFKESLAGIQLADALFATSPSAQTWCTTRISKS